MDLERDQSGLYSVRDSKAVVESVAAAVTVNDVDSSRSYVNEGVGYLVEKGNQNWQPSCSPGMNAVSPSASGGSAPKKGYGLKKWKRITRKEVIANSSPCLDTGKVLKRGLSASTNPLSHFPQLTEEKQGTDNFGGPVTTLETNLGGLNYFPAQASSSTAFAVGAVSENSEDRSSKSSTAASAPRHGFGMPSVYPFSGDKNKPKNLSGKGLITSNHQKSQVGKGRSDPSKKLRGGERIKYEKENSHSSIESDPRSSNFVFMQGSNGRQSEASINYNERSDEDIPGEPQFTDDLTAYSEANAPEAEYISPHDSGADLSWEGTEENGGNHQSPARQDPLVDSILTLDSVSEALEKELQKFKELGKGSYFTSAFSVNPFDSMDGEDLAQNATGSVNFTNKISFLESQLEEARDALRTKESKVDDLEATLHSASLHRGDTRNEAQAQEQEATKKLEEELEILFVQKLEADFKYLATANALQDAKYAPANPKTLLAEQKAVAEEQLHLRNRLEQTECKVRKIKRQAKELESYSADFVETDQVLSVQRSINTLSCCSLAQLLMLLAALWAMYFQMVFDSSVIVPT